MIEPLCLFSCKRSADVSDHCFNCRSGRVTEVLLAVLSICLLLICRDNTSRRIHDSSKSVFIEEVHQIFALAALRTISRHEYICFRHDLPENFSHLRISSSDYSSHVAVLIAHAVRAPLGDLLSYQFIERTSVDQSVLELAAGRIGCLDQYEDSFLLFFAYINKRIYPVRTQIRK